MTRKRFFRNTLGALITTMALGIITETTASADEGMWLPSLIWKFFIAVHGPESVTQVIVFHAAVLLDLAVAAVVIGQEQSLRRDDLACADFVGVELIFFAHADR